MRVCGQETNRDFSRRLEKSEKLIVPEGSCHVLRVVFINKGDIVWRIYCRSLVQARPIWQSADNEDAKVAAESWTIMANIWRLAQLSSWRPVAGAPPRESHRWRACLTGSECQAVPDDVRLTGSLKGRVFFSVLKPPTMTGRNDSPVHVEKTVSYSARRASTGSTLVALRAGK